MAKSTHIRYIRSECEIDSFERNIGKMDLAELIDVNC